MKFSGGRIGERSTVNPFSGRYFEGDLTRCKVLNRCTKILVYESGKNPAHGHQVKTQGDSIHLPNFEGMADFFEARSR